MKPIDTINYKGCTINVHQDNDAENPFKAFDCEPPLAVHYDRGVTYYGDVPCFLELVNLFPAEVWKRGARLAVLKNLNASLKEFAEYRRYNGSTVPEAFAALLLEQAPEPDRGWRDAKAHFETLKWLSGLAGIPCHYAQSNGYSQGDSALVIAFATPEWVKTVGAPADSLQRQCKGAVDLYSAWAWGDCYGYTCEDENGQEIDDGSCWGFYGRDHKESGLQESAENAIDWHIERAAKEKIEADEMACRDIMTA